MKWTGPLLAALAIAGCSRSTAPAEMPARSWKYYAAHQEEIASMQAICRQWAASNVGIGSEPAVVAGNCRAAAFAESMLATSDPRAR